MRHRFTPWFVLALVACEQTTSVTISYFPTAAYPAELLRVTIGARTFRGDQLTAAAEFANSVQSLATPFAVNASLPIRVALVRGPGDTLAAAGQTLTFDDWPAQKLEIYATRFGPDARLCIGPQLAAPIRADAGGTPDTLYVLWAPWPRPIVC